MVMKLFSFGKKSRLNDDEVLIVDVGNGSVGIAWTTIAKKESSLLFTHREHFSPLDVSTYENLSKEIRRY